MRLLGVVVVALLASGALVAGGVAGASAPSKSKANTVTIKNFKFSPSTLNVNAGAKVTVKNSDDSTHTFTANKGAFDTGDIDGGSSKSVTIKKSGTYAYHCNIHNFMKGTIKAT
jgi:plastocyanin